MDNNNNLYDIWSSAAEGNQNSPQRVIQEVMHDTAPKHNFKQQIELHERIRNDEDYDDWSYGTEPTYGLSWK